MLSCLHYLVKKIYKTAIHLHDPVFTCDERGQILSHIRSHIDLWLQPALLKIDQFTPQAKANSLWALAVIDCHYANDSLKHAYDAIRSHITLAQISDYRALQQIRDADLWFTGQSPIKHIKQPHQEILLDFENNIKDAFNRTSNLKAYRTPDPVISELKQGIDFMVTDNADNVPTEVEGPSHYANLAIARRSSELEINARTYFRRALQRRICDPDMAILCTDLYTSKIIESLHRSSNPKDKAKMQHLCATLFDAAASADGGVYKTIETKAIITPVHPHDRNLQLTLAA